MRVGSCSSLHSGQQRPGSCSPGHERTRLGLTTRHPGDNRSRLTSGMQLGMVRRDSRDTDLGDELLQDPSFCHVQGVTFPGDPTQPVHPHSLAERDGR